MTVNAKPGNFFEASADQISFDNISWQAEMLQSGGMPASIPATPKLPDERPPEMRNSTASKYAHVAWLIQWCFSFAIPFIRTLGHAHQNGVRG